MPVKSIIDIDVNDAQFKRFVQLFKQYQEQLAKTPDAWAKGQKEEAKMAASFERIAAAMQDQGKAEEESDDADEKRAKRLSNSEKLWTSMAKSSGSMAKSVLDIGAGVLKWGSIIAGGLLGGSLFGIDRMASAVSNERRSSLGLGLSIGEQKAFGTNLGRFVDPGAFLGGINSAVSNVANQGPLYALGVNPNQSTSDVAIDTLKAVRARALATPINQLGLLGSMYNLDKLGIGNEDVRRLRATPNAEFNQQLRAYKQDRGAFDLPPAIAKEWQEFTTQMSRAGNTIFKVFVTGLAPLAGPIEHLSGAIVKTVGSLTAKGGLIEQGINSLAAWIEKFSLQVASDQFQQAVTKLMSSAGDLADVLHALAHPIDSSGVGVSHMLSSIKEWLQPTPVGITQSKESYNKYLSRKDAVYGFPEGTLERMWQTESGANFYPVNSPKGAKGPFQFMPDTAAQYKINPSDPTQAANGAARYLRDLDEKYQGDMAKALAAYNLGPSKLDDILKQHPDDWMKYVPGETRNYVQKTQGTNILIQNNTGGSATVTASQLAQ